MIKAIGFVSYPVRDMKRAKKFYEEIFNLTPNPEFDPNNESWTEYIIGNGALSLGKMDGWEPTGNGPAAAFEVENFDAVIARLKEHKVHFVMEPQKFPNCQMALIHDSEGNSITIHKLNDK
jgi:predicted enzyme related to lactoylglutathione lyase